MTIRTAAERISDVRRLQRAARAVIADSARLVPVIARSTALSIEGVELALAHHLEVDATDAELASLVERAGDTSHVAVVLSANVFVGALRALAIARAASTDVVVRPSRRDPAFALALVQAAIAEGDHGLRIDASIDVAALTDGEIHVYGRDETIAAIRKDARARVRGHRSGMGVVWISASADLEDAARALADDIVVFDQRGCLSPRVALVHGDQDHALRLADALHRELEERATQVPRGEVPHQERAEASRYLTTMTYAGHTRVGRQHGLGIAAPGAPLVLPPPYRHLHLAPCASPAVAAELLAPLAQGIVTLEATTPRLRSLSLRRGPGAPGWATCSVRRSTVRSISARTDR